METSTSFPPERNHAAVRRVLWGVLGLNLLVGGLKTAAAIMTGSVAAMAEVIHGVLDASANVIALVGLSFAEDPPDDRHPYGHHRFESLAALAVGVLIAAGMVEVLRALWAGIMGKRAVPAITLGSALLLVASIAINFATSAYEASRGRALGSQLLLADAAHTKSDALGVCTVLFSFLGVHLGWAWLDAVGAGVVALLIGRTALAVLKENADALLDTAQLDPQRVHRIALSVPGVRGASGIRSRGAPGRVALDLCIQVDPGSAVASAHALSHRVQDTLKARFPGLVDVVIHIEPDDD